MGKKAKHIVADEGKYISIDGVNYAKVIYCRPDMDVEDEITDEEYEERFGTEDDGNTPK